MKIFFQAVILKQSEEIKMLTFPPRAFQKVVLKKINLNFFCALLCGPSKGFMKVFKAFIKPFEASHRSEKIKI